MPLSEEMVRRMLDRLELSASTASLPPANVTLAGFAGWLSRETGAAAVCPAAAWGAFAFAAPAAPAAPDCPALPAFAAGFAPAAAAFPVFEPAGGC